MTRLLSTVALSSLILAGATASGWTADPAYPPGWTAGPAASVPSWQSPNGWERDHSADDLNREALKRAMGTIIYPAPTYSAPAYPAPVYGGSGVPPMAPPYPGMDQTTTTTTTTTTIIGPYPR